MSLKDRIKTIEKQRSDDPAQQHTPPTEPPSRAGWRTTLTLWELPSDRDLLGAERAAERVDDHTGTLADVLRFAAAAIAEYHGAAPLGADALTLAGKIGSIRSRLSNGGGRMTQRVFYDWEGQQRLAQLEIKRVRA